MKGNRNHSGILAGEFGRSEGIGLKKCRVFYYMKRKKRIHFTYLTRGISSPDIKGARSLVK
jgi:hypothetical protein